MIWAWLVAGFVVLLAVVWWQRPRWLFWLGEPRPSRHERRRQRLRTCTSNAREMLLAGYARDALWWARRARGMDADDAQALAVMAAAHAHRCHYESAVRHWRLALQRAQESGLAAINREAWSHEAIEHATTLLVLADEDLSRRDALRQEARDWLQFALTNHPDSRVELNPRLKRLAEPQDWLLP